MAYPSSSLPRITFRLPEKLRARLADAAEEGGRSLNQEIVERLDLSFIHEIEGRDSDAASLRDEVMELRYALTTLTFTFLENDKRAFREEIEGVLERYRKEIEAIERDGKAARERHLARDEADDLLKEAHEDAERTTGTEG